MPLKGKHSTIILRALLLIHEWFFLRIDTET